MNDPPNRLIDSFGRVHDNLRVSVTDRCNLRCFYCMSEDVVFQPRDALLSFEELEQVIRISSTLGIRKIRVTGGEPLVRADLPVLIEKIVNIQAIEDVALTTNGILLDRLAQPLYDAGLRRLNISLDTFQEAKFEKLSRRRDQLDAVIRGIRTAQEVGFPKIKVNTVAMKGITEEELPAFARFARDTGIEVRFIEFMPLDADGNWQQDQVLWGTEIIEAISRHFPLTPIPEQDRHAPAQRFAFTDGQGTIGLIASVTQPFCEHCNRIRLTAEGKIRNCLFALDEFDIKALLRGGASDDKIAHVIRTAVQAKWEGHQINTARFVQPPRAMHAIGG